MSLTQALLGLLALEPSSGYELTKEFDGYLGRYAWQAGHTSIYPELIRMTERGLVEVAEEGPRGARTYAVTPAGRAELRAWLLSPSARGKVRNEQVLRLFLLDSLDTADALAVLRDLVAESERHEAELRSVRTRHDEEPPGGLDALGVLAAEYGVRQYEALRAWALWAMRRLEARAEEPGPALSAAGERRSSAERHDGAGTPGASSREGSAPPPRRSRPDRPDIGRAAATPVARDQP